MRARGQRLLALVLAILPATALAQRPKKPEGPKYDTVIITVNSSVLRAEGTGEPVNVTVQKGDRIEYRGLSDEGFIVRLFSATDWVLPKEDGERDPDFVPKPMKIEDKKALYFKLKAARKKAEAESEDRMERDILMDAACLDVFRESGQPTAVQREIMVLGTGQDW